ncbi:PP2C family protein-serine/threonine phosphatase [Nocardioides dongkuii]|uniref:PP2C family protein-serine/threonine phosphatase n=1 Tax=Nocardioides dongkuii TaxID=2760089 RepID=UPI0015FC57C3|nr:SpoIIE family protein phosphatase [Nocardioides dongkuii]
MDRFRLQGRPPDGPVVAASLALLGALLVVDLVSGVQLAGVYGGAAVVTSITSRIRWTAAVGAASIATAVASGAWHGTVDTFEFWVRAVGCAVIVLAAVGAAAVGQRYRRRLEATAHLSQRLLDSLAADLTSASTPREVAQSFVENAGATLAASSSRVFVLEGEVLRSIAWDGAGQGIQGKYDEVPLDSASPLAVAVRTATPHHYADRSEIELAFPDLRGYYTEERSLHLVPLLHEGTGTGLLALSFTPGRRPHGATTGFLDALGNALSRALQRAAGLEQERAAAQRLALLAEASMTLASTLELPATLDEIGRLLVPRFADCCVVQLLENGVLQTAHLVHADPPTSARTRALHGRFPIRMDAPAGPPQVVRTGVSEVHPSVPPELLAAAATSEEHREVLAGLGITSALVAPLRGRDRVLGAITLIHAASGRRYSQDDVSFLEDVADRAALALENAAAFREQRSRLADVTRVAEAAQRAILAPPPARTGTVALAARYVSAAADAQVGGDLYEVVPRPDGVRLLVGDVRGKGLSAVRTATIVLGEFRSAAADLDDLADVAVRVDRRLRSYLTDEDFVTACFVELRADGTYDALTCGHPAPVVVSHGQLCDLIMVHSPPLGLGVTPVVSRGTLHPGDRMVLFTDGLAEARLPNGEFVDHHAVLAPIAQGPLESSLDEALDVLRSLVGGVLGDDLALLVAEHRG